jgi:hypothetical protein
VKTPVKTHNPTAEEINLCIAWYRSKGLYAHEYSGVVFATFEALTMDHGTQTFTVMLHPEEVRVCAFCQKNSM